MVMFGGVAINPQITCLAKKVDIPSPPPGRLLDHCTQKTIDLSGVEILVLDEADRMLDMGFIRDIKKILALLPQEAPEPALLGHLLRRDQGPRRRPAAPARLRRGRPPQHRLRAGHPVGLPVPAEGQARAARAS